VSGSPTPPQDAREETTTMQLIDVRDVRAHGCKALLAALAVAALCP
jgi:hypothetical protein